MTVDFKTLLSKPADSVERPKPLPAGTYHGLITSYKYDESQQKKTPYVRLNLVTHRAGEDVDAELLNGVDLSKKQLRRDYFLTDDAMFRLKDLIESCGVQTTGRSMGELVPELLNKAVIISVVQRPSQDGSELYNDVKELAGEK